MNHFTETENSPNSRNSVSNPVGVEAWLVDLDGTLYSAIFVRLVMLGELLLTGWRHIRIVREFRKEHERMKESPAATFFSPYREQCRRVAERLGRQEQDVFESMNDWMIRRPSKWLWYFHRRSLFREIQEFRRRGGKTAIVSDYPAREKLRALRAIDLFDEVVANGEPGGPSQLKPSPDGFLRAAERLGVVPSKCLVIGDRLDADGEAAKSAGMQFRRVP